MNNIRLRIANPKDAKNIFRLKKGMGEETGFFSTLTDTLLFDRIVQEISQYSETKGLYVMEDEGEKLVSCCSLSKTLHRNGYTFLTIDFNLENSIDDNLYLINQYVQLCFNEFNYHKVNVQLRHTQIKQIEVYKKFGFCLEVIAKDYYYINGHYEDSCHFGLTKSDYISRKKPQGKVILDSTIHKDLDYLLEPQISPVKQLLIGKKVELVSLDLKDSEYLYSHSTISDEENYASIGAAIPKSRSTIEYMVSNHNDYISLQGKMIFGIKIIDGEIIGTINTSFVDLRNRHLMLGITIFDTSNRGQGYGGEAISLLTDFAFLELNMHRVYLGCFSFNEKAAKLYEHLGFDFEGVNRAFVYRNGRYYDEICFGATKESWLNKRGYL